MRVPLCGIGDKYTIAFVETKTLTSSMNNVNTVEDVIKLRNNKESEFATGISLDQYMQYQ